MVRVTQRVSPTPLSGSWLGSGPGYPVAQIDPTGTGVRPGRRRDPEPGTAVGTQSAINSRRAHERLQDPSTDGGEGAPRLEIGGGGAHGIGWGPEGPEEGM